MKVILTVPLEGDRTFKAALKSLASERGQSIGSLVRAAVDAAYGKDLEPHLSFFESRVTQMSHQIREDDSAVNSSYQPARRRGEKRVK